MPRLNDRDLAGEGGGEEPRDPERAPMILTASCSVTATKHNQVVLERPGVRPDAPVLLHENERRSSFNELFLKVFDPGSCGG